MEVKNLASIAREAGDELAKNFGRRELTEVVGIDDSGDETVRADQVAEEIILKELSKIDNVEVISEEAGRVLFGNPEYKITVDPLDGSSNYVRGVPVFAVSIEARHMPADEPAMAVIYEPMCRRMFSAERGRGAVLDGSKIHPNQERPFEDCLFDIDLHTAADKVKFERFVGAFRRFGISLKSFRSMGSCAIPLAYTACGILDGFMDFSCNSRMVDIAAGLVILQEAGGVATDIHGKPVEENYKSVIGCSTEEINHEVRELLAG